MRSIRRSVGACGVSKTYVAANGLSDSLSREGNLHYIRNISRSLPPRENRKRGMLLRRRIPSH